METHSLKNHDVIKQFLELLEYQGLTYEKQNLEFIIAYVDSTEKHLVNILDELKNVKLELSTMQNKTVRANTFKIVDNLTNRMTRVKEAIKDTKRQIKNVIEKGIKDFKMNGKIVLITTIQSLNIKGMLNSFRNCFDDIQKRADKSIDNLTQLGNQMHDARYYLKNFGRTLLGKNPIENNKRDHDKGIINIVQHGLFKVMEKMTILSAKTQKQIEKLEEQELTFLSNHPKISVKHQLNTHTPNSVLKKNVPNLTNER